MFCKSTRLQVVLILKLILKDENIIVYDEGYIHTWPKHPYDYLVQVIKEENGISFLLVVKWMLIIYTAFCHEKIKKGLPNAKIVDSDRLVNWARLVKSDAEIGFMKSAALISEKGMKTAMEVINPGVRQCDAVGRNSKIIILWNRRVWRRLFKYCNFTSNRKRDFSFSFNMHTR